MVFEDIILTEILAEELDRLMTDEYVNAIQDKKILEQQNKKLTDEVKQLKEESYSRLLRLDERNQKIQNLKEKIQELVQQITVRLDVLLSNSKTCDSDESLKLIDIRNKLKEILGEKA